MPTEKWLDSIMKSLMANAILISLLFVCSGCASLRPFDLEHNIKLKTTELK